MRKIKKYNVDSIAQWKDNETRVFNILKKISVDELKDLSTYRGCVVDGLNKTQLIKQFMVSMGNPLTNKHFSQLKI